MAERGDRTYSRRDILGMAGRGAILGATTISTGALAKYTFDRYAQPVIEVTKDWNLAQYPNEEFLKEVPHIANFRFGCSFSPEKFGLSPEDDGRNDKRGDISQNTLNYAVEELGIRDIRMGLWWSHTVDQRGEINLNFMGPYLDNLARLIEKYNGMGGNDSLSTTIQLGYKAIGWPEQHPPEYVTNLPYFPEPGAIISPDDQMGELCLDYIGRMSQVLKREYGQVFSHYQVENEPFQQFGNLKHEFTYDYIIRGMDIVFREFPNAGFKINSSPEKIPVVSKDFIPYLLKQRPYMEGILGYGLNLYEDKPNYDEPIMGEAIGQTVRTKFRYGPQIFQDNIRSSEELGYEPYVSELQFEKWGDRIASGNSPVQLRYQTLRAMRTMDLKSRASTGNLYGIEGFYFARNTGNFTDAHAKMRDLIKMVNKTT